jgi:hypothetical protein
VTPDEISMGYEIHRVRKGLLESRMRSSKKRHLGERLADNEEFGEFALSFATYKEAIDFLNFAESLASEAPMYELSEKYDKQKEA